MAKIENKTKLTLFLSTGNRVEIYFKTDVSESVDEELSSKHDFLVDNWGVSGAYIYKEKNLIFYKHHSDDEFPTIIPMEKIVGWSTREY